MPVGLDDASSEMASDDEVTAKPAVAHQEPGDRALACIGVSPSYPGRKLHSAVQLAAEQGWP